MRISEVSLQNKKKNIIYSHSQLTTESKVVFTLLPLPPTLNPINDNFQPLKVAAFTYQFFKCIKSRFYFSQTNSCNNWQMVTLRSEAEW